MTKTDDGDPRLEEIEQERWVESEWAREAKAYLVRLKSHLGKQESTDTSVSIPVAGNRFLVSPRERGLILGVDDPQAEPAGDCDELIRHSIGMQVMLMADVERYQKRKISEKLSAQRRFDAAIGYGDLCAYEMQRMVSTLSKEGDLEGGKQMAEYRRRLVGVLEKAGKVAGAEDNAPDVEHKASPAYDPRAAARAKAKAEVLNKKKKKKRDLSAHRKKLYVAGSIVLFALTAVILFRLWSGRERALESIKVRDLRNIPGVEQVLCRPPGVIVIVSEASWNGSSAEQKQHAIQVLVKVAEPLGYRRAEFRTSTTQDLALWFKGRNPQVRSR